MDLTSIIATLVLLIIIVIIAIVNKVIKLKKKNNIIKEFMNLANGKGCIISKFDFWNNTKIGFDMENGILFFIRNLKNHENKFVINLQDVLKCYINKVTRTVDFNRTKQLVTDRIELVFTFIDKNKPNVCLEFYNTDYDNLNLTGELQLAEKWEQIANSFMNIHSGKV